MKKSSFFSIVFVLFMTLLSCGPESDPVNPLLIKYTEIGANQASAFINDKPWSTGIQLGLFGPINNPLGFSNNINKDSFTLIFQGELSILFSLKGLEINRLKDFEKLSDKKITLDGVKNYASVLEYFQDNYSHNAILSRGKGQIYFRYINFDANDSTLILSGGFGFTEELQDTTVSYGRFDYRLTNEIFQNGTIN